MIQHTRSTSPTIFTAMSLNPSTFETILPSRYITFTLPDNLRVAVLDSPSDSTASACAMWVPPGRESDWVFSTFSGHLQLLISSAAVRPLARLILVGKSPPNPHPTSYDSTLHPSSPPPLPPNLLSALTPKSDGEIPEMPFLVYEDGLICSSVLEISEGPRVGEMLIENVELDINGVIEFRRRLRFKRMPNFVQSQMRIRPLNSQNSKFELDEGFLVQPYLSPMVAGISVISHFIDGLTVDDFRPKALCLGVGGGALLRFLSTRLNFEVVGVEEDEVVLDVAKKYFGLESNEFIRLFAEDGIKFVKRISKDLGKESRFHVVMVDLDPCDVTVGVNSPPVEFVRRSVLVAVKSVLCEEGVLVINTIPSSEVFYGGLIRDVFDEVYEIDVGNGENFVLIATKSKAGNAALEGKGGAFLSMLRSVGSGSYIDSIRKVRK